MDEPLSNLDAKLRVNMRAQLADLHARLGTTTVYVTHDQVEAMTLGQRVAVMRDGRLQQVASPQALYRRPANLFVAAFIGSPAMNLVEASARRRGGRLRQPSHPARGRPAAGGAAGARSCSASGPRPSRTARPPMPSLPRIEVTPNVIEELGADAHLIFAVDAPPIDVDERLSSAEEALLAVDGAVFNARVHADTGAQPDGRSRSRSTRAASTSSISPRARTSRPWARRSRSRRRRGSRIGGDGDARGCL